MRDARDILRGLLLDAETTDPAFAGVLAAYDAGTISYDIALGVVLQAMDTRIHELEKKPKAEPL